MKSQARAKGKVKGASVAFGSLSVGVNLLRPTYDQMYLMEKINEVAPKGRLTPAAIQRLNSKFGISPVVDALRSMRGFPPPQGFRSPYAYLVSVLARGV